MGIMACKGFAPGLICRGYTFTPGKVHRTDHANCARNGFHAAENPFDCLTYYPHFEQSEYWLVWCSGDLDEDALDSKITCTRLEPLRRLSRADFLLLAGNYIMEHPRRKLSGRVCVAGRAVADDNGMAAVMSAHPSACGRKIGDALLLIEGEPEREARQMRVIEIDGKNFFPDVWYSMRSQAGGGRHVGR